MYGRARSSSGAMSGRVTNRAATQQVAMPTQMPKVIRFFFGIFSSTTPGQPSWSLWWIVTRLGVGSSGPLTEAGQLLSPCGVHAQRSQSHGMEGICSAIAALTPGMGALRNVHRHPRRDLPTTPRPTRWRGFQLRPPVSSLRSEPQPAARARQRRRPACWPPGHSNRFRS